MANQPTIVVAKLDDEKLKASIDKMVNDLNTGLNKMTANTDAAVAKMQASLQSVGNIKFGSGGSDGGSSKRTKKQHEEAEAVKQTADAYDKLAQSQQKTSKKKGIEYISIPIDVQEGLTYLINVNKNVDTQLDSILQKEQAVIAAKEKEAQASREVAEAEQQRRTVSGKYSPQNTDKENERVREARANWEAYRKEIHNTTSAYSNMQQAIASALNIQSQEIHNYNIKTASVKQLNMMLKQQEEAYSRLTLQQRYLKGGTELSDSIRRLQRQIAVIRNISSRPISLKVAMDLPSKNLDEIAYKMQMLRSYRSGLDFSNVKGKEEIEQVNKALEKLRLEQNKILGQNKDMLAANNALARSFNYMKNRLAFYFTVGASTQFVKNLIEIRSQYEMNERALGILLDSASRGTRIFSELSEMSLVSPYTLIELSNAAKQLTAYDIAAKDVVDTTRRLADMASAVGVPVERLTYALGQIKAYGYLNSRDARMFANAGIPLVRELAKYYSELRNKMVSTADVYDMMKKKAIDYNDVMNVVNKMTDEGGKFFDFQAKMADTLKVRLANLTLAWNNMLNDIGKDSQGMLTTTIKGLATVFKHWREIFRVLGTVATTFGVYKAVQMAALFFAKAQLPLVVKEYWALATSVKSSRDAMQALLITAKAVPFVGWVTAIASIVSYFYLFNKSSDGVKQKLEEISNAFDGVRKEATDAFAEAIRSDSIGTQLNKLRDMLELAENEMHVTIPINLEDVNESNIKQKLKEAKQFIDEYINFSQTFSEAAAGTKFNELMNEFGSKARSTYTNISESINSVVAAIQELQDKGKASKRDIEILNELVSGQGEDESRIEYLQRLVRIYEELGLIGQKTVTPKISFFSSSEDNVEELTQRQESALDRLGIKNKSVFSNMLVDVQDYYSKSSIAQYQFEQQVMRVAQKIDINKIPAEQRTLKLNAAINEEASLNNWNQFEKELARQVANKKFGTNITISDDSKKSAETELQEWQKKQQRWMDDHGLKITLSFQTNDTEVSYAKRMLQEAKDAAEEYQTQLRKLERGTGSQDAVDKALKSRNEARQKYFAAGGDMSLLDKKENAARKKAIKEAESELQKALKNELQLIEKVRSNYKELTKAGVTHAEAISSAISGYDQSVANINAVLKKYGVGLDLSKFAGNNNPHALLAMLQKQLDALKGKAKPAEIQALEVEIQKVKLDVDKFDTTQITDALNRELGNIKDEYELALELDANPELGGMFANIFGIDTSTLPKTFSDALDRAQIIINRKLAEMNITTPFDLMEGNIDSFAKSTGLDKDGAVIKELVSAQNAYRDMFKKNITETEKVLDDYIKKYGDYSDKIAEIEASRLEKLKKLNEAYYTEEMRKRPEYIAKLNAIEQGASKEKQQVDFDEFKNSRYYTMMFENLDYISTKTLTDMRDRLRDYINTAKDLNPEQLKTLISQYEKIEQKVVKRSPFKNLAKDLKEYFKTSKERKSANAEFKNAQKEYDVQKKNVAELKKKYEQAKANSNTSQAYLDFLQIEIDGENEVLKILKEQLEAAEEKANKYNLIKKLALEEAAGTANTLATNLQSLGELRDQFNELFGVDASKGETLFGHNIDGMVDGLAKAGQSISKIISSATNGDVFGVVGGVVGVFTGIGDSIASIFGDGAARTRRLNREINNSIENVRKLTLAYKDLEYAVENEMGAAELQARRQEMVNKEAQLRELQRQKQLEEQKRSKDRDDDRIKELESSIKDLQIEIKEMADDVAATLLGGKVKDAAEEFVSTWVDAWRAGEDTMAAMESKFDDMIDNMIMKSVASRVVANHLQQIWDTVDAITKESSEGGTSVTMNELDRIKSLIGDKSIREAINDDLKALYTALGIAYGSGADKELSALQQGLQGMSENTAGALEAYWNINTQQQFVHTDLLTQIRDIVSGFDTDIQTATLGQILLQLQASYQVQQSIQMILEGVLVPSGRAFAVELIS